MDVNPSATDGNDTLTSNFKSTEVQWSFVIPASIILVTTLGCNICVIIRLQWKAPHKQFTKFFLVSLAGADILLALTVIPFSILGFFYDNRKIFGDVTCEIVNSCDVMFTSTSILHLSVLAFDRFVAIRWPYSVARVCNRKRLIIFFILCWTIPAALSFGLIMPGLHVRGVEQFVDHESSLSLSCVLIVNVYYATIPAIVVIFLPTILIIFFNVNICLRLRKRRYLRKCTQRVHDSSVHGGILHKVSGGESRIAITICSMTLAFILCWVPFFIFNIIGAATMYRISEIILPVCIWLGYANSAINPIVFLILEFCQK